MAKMKVWPLSSWEAEDQDVLELSEPRLQGVAYTRGYRTVAGVLDVGRRQRMEWALPSSLFPDVQTADGFPLPVVLGKISWHPEFLVMSAGRHPAAIVTVLQSNRVRVHTIPSGHVAGDMIGAVCATAAGHVWYVGRTGGPGGGLVIGRMRPDNGEFTYWRPALGFGISHGLAIEDGGKVIWTSAIMGPNDFRHALVRLNVANNEFTTWALAEAGPTYANSALQHAWQHGLVAVTPAANGTRQVWWLMHSPHWDESGGLVSVNPVTGRARDHGPWPTHRPAPGRTLALSLDAKFRPWVTFRDGFLGGLTRPECGEPFQLKVRRFHKRPERAIFEPAQTRVRPTVESVIPQDYVSDAAVDGCFETRSFPPGTYPFSLTGNGLPLAEQGGSLFASNGLDRIFQIMS